MAGDAVWLEVLPELSGFGRVLGAGTEKAAGDAGKRAGGAFSALFARAAGDTVVREQTAELEKAAKAGEKAVESATQGIAKARAAQRESAAKTLEAEAKLADTLGKYGDESKQAEAASERLEAARGRQAEASRKVETAEAGLRAAHDQSKQAVKELADATEDSAGKAEKSGGVWGGLKDKFSAAGGAGGIGGLVGKIGGLAAAAGASMVVADQLGQAWEQAWERAGAVTTLNAQLGLTEEQTKRAGEAAQDLWRRGFGENIGEATSSVGAVMSSIEGMRDASTATLEDVTSRAVGFAEVFDVDVSEAARNAGILIANGLAPDAVAAFDLMTAGLQNIPAALRGEVMDATQEYSKDFAELGFTGAEAIQLIGRAAITDGQYGIDKMGDALKEFGIRTKELNTPAVVDAYELIGLSAEEMAGKILQGGSSAQDATQQIVNGLLGVNDPAAQAEAALALFGTPLEDLGTTDLPVFLESLLGAGEGLEDTKDKSDDLVASVEANQSPIDSLTKSFQTVVAEGLEPFIEPAEKVAKWAQDNPGAMQNVVMVLGLLAAAFLVAAVAVGIFMLVTSPITLTIVAITLGVALLVAGIVLLAKNWDEIWGKVKSFFVDTIGPAITGAIDVVIQWFEDMWEKAGELKDKVVEKITAMKDAVVDAITGLRDRAGERLTEWRDGAVTKATELRDGVSAKAGEARDWVTDKLTGLKDQGIEKFQNLKDGALERLRGLRDEGEKIADGMRDLMGRAWDKLPGRFKQPIIDLLNWVNNNLIGKVNLVAQGVGLGSEWIPKISVPKLATGGTVPGWSPNDSADNIPAMLTADEEVIRVRSARKMRRENPGVLEHINRTGTLPGTGGLSFADGMAAGASLRLAEGGRVFPLPAGSYRQTQGVHGVDRGYDYAAPIGTPIMANADATVLQARTLSGSYGRYVRLSNGSVYAHMNSYGVQAGQQVRAGQQIGTVGWSGNVRPPGPGGAHLHYVPGGALGSVVGSVQSAMADVGDMLKDRLGDVAGLAARTMSGAGPFGAMLAKIPPKLATAAASELRKKALAGLDNVASGVASVASTPLKIMARSMLNSRGWGQHWGSFDKLVQGESSWNPLARNPSSGAYGLPQSLPASKMASAGADWRTNPATQLRWMLGYIDDRYGNPSNAYNTWQRRSPHWYDNGGELQTGLTLVNNQTGGPEPVLTRPQWDTAAAAIREVTATGTGRAGTHIDRADFHVTVNADDLDGAKDAVELFERLGFEAQLQRV